MNVVEVVIFFDKGKVFGDLWDVWSWSGAVEGENEVDLSDDEEVVGGESPEAIEGSVICLLVLDRGRCDGDVEGIGMGAGGAVKVLWSGVAGSMGLAFGAGGGTEVGGVDVGNGGGGVGPAGGRS